MSENTRTVTTLHDLLDYDARKFIIAEVQLKNALKDWINKATALKLKVVLQKYEDLIQQHVQKMEGFFVDENITSLSLTNQVMHAFIKDTDEKLGNCTDAEVKDAGLLASIQAVNHYKISAYGTAAAFANLLGMEKYAAVFQEAEVNEKQVDDRLSQLAEHEVNPQANKPIELER